MTDRNALADLIEANGNGIWFCTADLAQIVAALRQDSIDASPRAPSRDDIAAGNSPEARGARADASLAKQLEASITINSELRAELAALRQASIEASPRAREPDAWQWLFDVPGKTPHWVECTEPTKFELEKHPGKFRRLYAETPAPAAAPTLVDWEFDLKETLKAVLLHFGTDGTALITGHVMQARKDRGLAARSVAVTEEPPARAADSVRKPPARSS